MIVPHHRAAVGLDEDLLPAAPQKEAGEEEDLSDEALALRLQQEELAAQNARFMQMAGIGTAIVPLKSQTSTLSHRAAATC